MHSLHFTGFLFKLKFNHIKRRKSKKHSLSTNCFCLPLPKAWKGKMFAEGPRAETQVIFLLCSHFCFHLIMITKFSYSNSIFQIVESHYTPLAYLPKFCKLMQNLRGHIRCIMGDVEVACKWLWCFIVLF